MLDLVAANSYVMQVPEESGASCPLVLTVSSADKLFETYVKITDGKRITVQSLVIEAISSILAVDLDLPTPEPFLVQLSPAFIASVMEHDIKQRLNASCPIAFGTKGLSHAMLVPCNMELDNRNQQAAAEILAFDALIDNPDRGGSQQAKNNCLICNDIFYIIDHEKALQSAVGIIFGAKEPWLLGGLEHLKSPNSHLFINQLRKMRKKISRNATPTRSDEKIWGRFSKELENRELLNYFEKRTLNIGGFEETFDHTYQNGMLHCLKPISFDLADEENIKNKMLKETGRIDLASRHHSNVIFYCLVGKPQNPALLEDYNRAKAELLGAGGRVFDEDNASELPSYLQSNVQFHS